MVIKSAASIVKCMSPAVKPQTVL